MLESKTLRKHTKLSPKLNTLSEKCSETLQKNRNSSNTSSKSNCAENSYEQKNSKCLRKNKSKENVKDNFTLNSQQAGSNNLEQKTNSEYRAWWEKSENKDEPFDRSEISSCVSSAVNSAIKTNKGIMKHRASLVYPVSTSKYKAIPFTFSIHCGTDEGNIKDKISNETGKYCHAKLVKNGTPDSSMENNTDKQKSLNDAIYHGEVNDKTFPGKSQKCPSSIDYRNLTDYLYNKMNKNELVSTTNTSNKNDSKFCQRSNQKKNAEIKRSEENISKQRTISNKKTEIYFNEKNIEDYKCMASKINNNRRINPKAKYSNTNNTKPHSDYPNINARTLNKSPTEDGVSNYVQEAALTSNDGSLNMRPDKLSNDLIYPTINANSMNNNNYGAGASKQETELMPNSSNYDSLNIRPSKFSHEFAYPTSNCRSQSINSYKSDVISHDQESEFISNTSEDSSDLLVKHKYPLWRETKNYLMERKKNSKLKQRNNESDCENIYTKITQSSTSRNIPKNKKTKAIAKTSKDLPSEFQPQCNSGKNNEKPLGSKGNRALSPTVKVSKNKLKPTICTEVTNSDINDSNNRTLGLTGNRILSPTVKLSNSNVKLFIYKEETNYEIDEDFQRQDCKHDAFDNTRSNNSSLDTNFDEHSSNQCNNNKSDVVSQANISPSKKMFSPFLRRSKTPNEDIIIKDEKPKKKELKPLVHFVNGKNDFKVNTKEKLAKFNLGDAMTYTLYGTNTFTDKKSHTENQNEPYRNCHKSHNVVSSPVNDMSSQLICADQSNINRNEITSNIIQSPCSPIIQEAESECVNCCKHTNVITNYPNGLQNSCNGFSNICKQCGYVNPSYQSNSYNFNRINVPIMSQFPSNGFVEPTQISPFLIARSATTANCIPFTNQAELPVYFNGFGMIRNMNKYFYQPEVSQIQFPTPTMMPVNSPMFIAGNIPQMSQNNPAFNIAPVYTIAEIKDKSQPLPCIMENNSVQQPEKSQDKSTGVVYSSLQSIKEEGRKIGRELSSGKSMAEILHFSPIEIKSDKSERSNIETPISSVLNKATNECNKTLNSDSHKGKNKQPTQERKFTGIIPGLY